MASPRITRITNPPETPRDWTVDAACRGMDTAMFFPEAKDSAEPALAVCRQCKVAVRCYDYARETGIREGIWGGRDLTPRYVQPARFRKTA